MLAQDAPGNVIVVSVPSLLDPDLAPEGHHTIHAYTAGNEPYSAWEQFEGVSNCAWPRGHRCMPLDVRAPLLTALCAGALSRRPQRPGVSQAQGGARSAHVGGAILGIEGHHHNFALRCCFSSDFALCLPADAVLAADDPLVSAC